MVHDVITLSSDCDHQIHNISVVFFYSARGRIIHSRKSENCIYGASCSLHSSWITAHIKYGFLCGKPALLRSQQHSICIYFNAFSFATLTLFLCISACLRGIRTHFTQLNMLWHHAGLSGKLQLRGTWYRCQTCLPLCSLNHFSPCSSFHPPVSSSVSFSSLPHPFFLSFSVTFPLSSSL